jgi:hypothetical protein
MNGKALLVGLLVVALGVPCSFADDPPPDKPGHDTSPEARLLPGPPPPDWFGPDPLYPQPYDAQEELAIYAPRSSASGSGRHMNPTAFPPVDLGLGLYDRGAYTPRPTFLGTKNPIMSAFMMFGDLRVAGTHTRGGKADDSAIAARLNLDMDWQFTPTERVHAFVRPLDKGGLATRYQFNGGGQDKFVRETNFSVKTLFFEGDMGAMSAGLTGRDNTHDIPLAVGRVPIFTQNGIWIDDAIDGAGLGLLTAKNNPRLDISNFDLTLFAGFHNVTSPAIAATDKSAKIFGAAGFFDALTGYTEFGYGYFNDGDNSDLSYHNVTAAFSKRYMGKIANSVRVLGNFGQNAPVKTADGVLLLVESSLVRGYYANINPLTFVPYLNLFAGFGHPQSLARAGDAGGVLKNTGINFETDGLTGYPTIDATAHDTYGGAIGLEYLFHLDRQIVVEVARVQERNNSLPGGQTAIGARYQHPITNAWIVRLDAMKGWRQGLGQKDIYGARLEIRRKF